MVVQVFDLCEVLAAGTPELRAWAAEVTNIFDRVKVTVQVRAL